MRSILVIEPCSSGLELIPTARTMGLHPIVMTYGQDDRTVPARYLAAAHRVEIVDTNREPLVIEAAHRLAAEADVAAVLPGFEYYVPTAARVAAALGLRGLPPSAVDALRLKDRMRDELRRAGLATPAYHRIEHVSEAARAIPASGFPYVVKPTDASGSLNVTKVHDRRELEAALRRVLEEDTADLGWSFRRVALVEEYIEGPEYSVEGLVHEDRVDVVSITEKLLGPEPNFVEVGHIVNAAIDPAEAARIEDYTARVVRALGVSLGPFHAELRLSRRGAVLMEIAARLAGDRICDLILAATGVNLYEEMIRAYLGAPPRAPAARARRAAGIRYLSAAGLAAYHRVVGVDDLGHLPGFREFGTLVPPGAPIASGDTFLARIAYAIFCGDDFAAVKRAIEAVPRTIHFQGVERMNIVLINRWDDDFAAYDNHIDHDRHRVHYVVSADGRKGIEPFTNRAAAVVEVSDLNAGDEVERAFQRVAAGVEARGERVDKVIALSEFDLLNAGRLRSRFGVPGPGIEAVSLVRDKVAMKARVAAFGVRVPRFRAVRSIDDVRAFAAEVGYPIVLKPRRGAASRGVLAIDGPDALDVAVAAEALDDHECEEFVGGPIYHADGLRYRGETVFRTISRYVSTCLAYSRGAPLGSVTEDDPGALAALDALVERSLAALDLADGAFHLEMILADEGAPCFLEIGARIGGGEIPFVVRDVFGVDLVGAWLRIELGTFDPSEIPRRPGFVGWVLVPEPREVPCRVVRAESLLGKLPTLYREILPAPGDVLDGHGGYAKIAGRFQFQGDAPGPITRDVDAAIRGYRIEYEAVGA